MHNHFSSFLKELFSFGFTVPFSFNDLVTPKPFSFTSSSSFINPCSRTQPRNPNPFAPALNPTMSIIPPELFTCPISLDLFTDPVTLSTGQTYDRPFITKWFSSGNLTCPVTMQKLTDLSLVPNHTLRHLIDRWLETGDHRSKGRYSCPDGYLDELRIRIECEKDSGIEQKLKLVKEAREMVRDVVAGRYDHRLAQSGILESLMEFVIAPGCEFCEGFVEEVLETVVELVPFVSDFGCLSCMIVREPYMDCFVVLLENGSGLIKIRLCHLIEAMAVSPSAPSLEILESELVIKGVISVSHCHDLEVSGSGVKAISQVCLIGSCLQILVQENAIDALIGYIPRAQRVEKNGAVRLAMRAIEVLILDEVFGNVAKESVLRNPNGVQVLVKMVFRVSDHEGSDSAMNCLFSLCYESMEAREEAIELGVLTQLLLLLQSQCSEWSQNKARMLLKLLGSMWDKRTQMHV